MTRIQSALIYFNLTSVASVQQVHSLLWNSHCVAAETTQKQDYGCRWLRGPATHYKTQPAARTWAAQSSGRAESQQHLDTLLSATPSTPLPCQLGNVPYEQYFTVLGQIKGKTLLSWFK